MKTVVGLFDNYNEARTAMNDLISAGFSQNDISLVASNANNRFADGSGRIDDTYDTTDDDAQPARDGAGTGAVVGTLVGGGAMLAASAGLLLIPGVGPVLAAGPLIATLTGAGVGALAGAAIGGLVGGLVGAGVPEHEAGVYAEGVRRGGTLLAVRSEDNLADDAADVLSRHGAVDIDQRAEYYQSTGYTGYNADAPHYTAADIERERTDYATRYGAATATAPAMSTAGTVDTAGATLTGSTANVGTTGINSGLGADINRGGEAVLPVIEEELQVGKRQVQSGGVRVYTHVTETPATEQVSLHEERVTVNRRPVDRPLTDADVTAFREGSIEVTETAEVPVVSKEARIVEEVVVGKTATDRMETVSDTVRRTDVEVEQIPGQTVIGATTTGHVSRDLDGAADTRGVGEKITDAATGDRVDDKTGHIVR